MLKSVIFILAAFSHCADHYAFALQLVGPDQEQKCSFKNSQKKYVQKNWETVKLKNKNSQKKYAQKKLRLFTL